jgi:hypothetical protein
VVGYTYVDPYGAALSYEDVFTKLENAKRHYDSLRLEHDSPTPSTESGQVQFVL